MSEGRTGTPQAYFTDRCPILVETARDTFVGCGLKIGHEGPHKPPPRPKQVAA